MNTKRTYTEDFRKQAVAMVAANKLSIVKAAEQLKIPGQTLWTWVNEATKPRGAATKAKKKVFRPRAYMLKCAREVIHNNWTIEQGSKHFNIPESTLSAWVKKARRGYTRSLQSAEKRQKVTTPSVAISLESVLHIARMLTGKQELSLEEENRVLRGLLSAKESGK